MRSLDDARRRGRECRTAVDARPEGTLRERLVGYIEDVHEFYPEAVPPGDLGTDKALLDAPNLYYDAGLEETLADLVLQLAHELGHLEQHDRVKQKPSDPSQRHRSGRVVPLASAPYVADQDTVAVARYSTRSLEEAEATAFAVDFLCPSDRVFEAWRDAPGVSILDLSAQFEVPVEVARAQLAAAVYDAATGPTDTQEVRDRGERTVNHAQDRAVYWPALEAERPDVRRPLLVDAGPGTGKTATLVRRVVHLVESGQAGPSEILVLTFSNEAARELQDRLRRALGPDGAQGVMVATFHGFGRHVLHYLGGRFKNDLPGAVPVLDQASQEELVLDLLGREDAAERYRPLLKLSDLRTTANDAVRHITHLKQRLWSAERLRSAVGPDLGEEDRRRYLALADLYEAYDAEAAARGAVDFADLILLPLHLLTADEHAEAAEAVRAQYPHVLVDEFQDVSEATGRLLAALCSPEHPPWVVGDARQAIYRFLGAHPGNVSGFLSAFDDAERIGLDVNYRSCLEVVGVNNDLAALMEDPELGAGADRGRWVPQADAPVGYGVPVVEVVQADSDVAERLGIADHVRRLVCEEKVPAGDVAVLARRNVDVRAIALKLGERGVEVSTAGLVTTEGAAGDLLAAASARDARDVAATRLGAALGQGAYEKDVVNTAIRRLRGEPDSGGPPEAEILEANVQEALDALFAAPGRPDAFGQITALLFEASPYLRRVLDAPPSAALSMALSEIAVSLSEAGLYRFTHGEDDAATARRGFAAYFERKLREGTPSRVVPGASSGAVRVLTVHASKGLQFPHVVVAGQTMSPKQYWSSRQYAWAPPEARPTESEDTGQADALLFVGVSRAERSVLVSYAATATPSERARERPRPPLLDLWLDKTSVPRRTWPSVNVGGASVVTGRVWGGAPRERMNARSFRPRSCAIKAYLGEELHLNLPEADRALYPAYFSAVRRGIGAVVERANDGGQTVTRGEALAVVAEVWPPSWAEGHRHLPMFTHELARAVVGFAKAYRPLATEYRPLDLERAEAALGDPAPGLRFSSAFVDDAARAQVIIVRPESLASGLAKRNPGKGNLNWSGGDLDAEQIRMVALWTAYPNAKAFVYSVADGVLYEWNPPSPPNKGKLASDVRIRGEIEEVQHQFATGELVHEVKDFDCGRCRRRTVCPVWLELAVS